MTSFVQPSYQNQAPVAPPSYTQTFIDTIANRNATEANQLLTHHGYTPATSIQSLTKNLAHFILVNGDTAIKQLSHIHPDKEMILDNIAAPNQNNFLPGNNFAQPGNNNYHNCTGCGGTCGAKQYNNADGATQNGAQTVGFKNESTMQLVAILALVGVIAMVVIHNK